MKPYGREKNLKGSGLWKKDFHIHHKNRKVGNWWEDRIDFLFRSRMKQDVTKHISEEIYENKYELVKRTAEELAESRCSAYEYLIP